MAADNVSRQLSFAKRHVVNVACQTNTNQLKRPHLAANGAKIRHHSQFPFNPFRSPNDKHDFILSSAEN
jgi:hypothetical protein